MRRVLLTALIVAAASCATPPPPQSAAYGDYLVGRVANLRADHEVATERYFAALARAPGNPALIEGALISSLAAGDQVRLRQAARLAPAADAPAYAHIVRAVDAIAGRNWRAASRHLARVEGAAAEELIARLLAVWARAGEGRAGDGAVDLLSLTAMRPYGALFGYQHAMALDYAGKQDAALTAYEAARQGGMWLPLGVAAHADLLARRGERDAAIALLSTEENRTSPALVAALEHLQAGAAAAQRPLTPARGAAAGMLGLAALFAEESDANNRLAALTLALMLDPELDAAQLAFAQAQSELGHVERARAALSRIAPDSEYAPSAQMMEARILLDSGDQEGALALARATAQSGETRAVRTLADLYRNLERYSDAEPLYSDLIARAPQDWRLYFARGAARERLGRGPEAEADLRQALALSPDQAEVLNYLGYIWVDRGEHLSEALAMIERAVELRPMSGAIIDSLGWAHYRLGDYPRALEILEHAVGLEPAQATLNDHLGDVYWRLGRRIEARFQWRRALSFGPEDAAAIQAKIERGLPELAPTNQAAR